ncbi:hypothetical protein NDU88_005556, partial [Pleurodeles waltl]
GMMFDDLHFTLASGFDSKQHGVTIHLKLAVTDAKKHQNSTLSFIVLMCENMYNLSHLCITFTQVSCLSEVQ